jgi:lysozyme family protein
MADAEKLKPFILKWEGGFSNDPSDKGGATNKGITIATFRQYYGSKATIEQLKNITDEQWLTIFKIGYWYPFKGDYINNQSVANLCVDWAWNSGTKTAIKQVQRVLGVDADGIVGNITVNAINKANQKLLFENIKKARLQYVNDIVRRNSSQAKFINGWTNRINALTYSE